MPWGGGPLCPTRDAEPDPSPDRPETIANEYVFQYEGTRYEGWARYIADVVMWSTPPPNPKEDQLLLEEGESREQIKRMLKQAEAYRSRCVGTTRTKAAAAIYASLKTPPSSPP